MLLSLVLAAQASTALAYEAAVDGSIDARAEYNDNIFLTSGPHDSVYGVVVTPALDSKLESENWLTSFQALLRNHRYSDQSINTVDQFFDLIGQYQSERNIFALNLTYDLDSNLNSDSTEFGVVGRRINKKNQVVTPSYTFLASERLLFKLLYNYQDVDYLEAEDTGLLPYITNSLNFLTYYNLSERTVITFSLTGVDYTSKNDLVTYELLQTVLGVEHNLNETFSFDINVGISRRNVTNLSTQSFDLFGNIITQTTEVDFSDQGLLYNIGIEKSLESGRISARLSRDDKTNSFGGLDQADRLNIKYDLRASEKLKYLFAIRFEDITSVSSDTRNSDRDLFVGRFGVIYTLTRSWTANASYRYVQRKLKSSTSQDRAPHSNRVYVGLTYNFPSFSTF